MEIITLLAATVTPPEAVEEFIRFIGYFAIVLALGMILMAAFHLEQGKKLEFFYNILAAVVLLLAPTIVKYLAGKLGGWSP